MNITAHIIEPCGFAWNDSKFRRAGMDYIDHVNYMRHTSWEHFMEWKQSHEADARLILLSTKAALPYHTFHFLKDDILMVGRESAGVPDEVHEQANERILIPMQNNMRSLNVAISAAIVTSEALRQTQLLPIV
jgi:tRNA (cytidine/uridine-2'-O-)-methyltransferase